MNELDDHQFWEVFEPEDGHNAAGAFLKSADAAHYFGDMLVCNCAVDNDVQVKNF